MSRMCFDSILLEGRDNIRVTKLKKNGSLETGRETELT